MNDHDRAPWARAARRVLATVSAGVVMIAAQPAAALWPSPALVSVDVYDRTTGTLLDVHAKDGQRYIVGTPGHEYSIRIRNNRRERIVAVTSVDGVNVVTGETASPNQSGYVIDGGGSVEIAGWRRSLERTAAFFFTDLGDSYAARTDRPANVGVVGIAVFQEREPIVDRPPRDRIAGADERASGDLPASAAGAPQAGAAFGDKPRVAIAGSARESRAQASKLGTGFGRDETSYAQRVRFERASDLPAETLALQYDRRENLIAMGVLPAPRYAQRLPDPFPAMHFVPEPR